jgi:hypothetical protein
MQTTNFYFLLFPLFFLVHDAPTPLLNVSQAVGWQENQLQIPIKEAQLFLQVSVWKRLSSRFAQAPAQPEFLSSHHSHSTTGSIF